MKASLNKFGTSSLEVFQNEMKHSEIRPDLKNQIIPGQSGSRGVNYIVKAGANYHELYLQVINIETDRSVKIPKQDLGEPKDNLWVALVLFMKDMEPVLYLIPSKILAQPDDYIFIDNDQGESFKHLSNWETLVHEYN